MTDSKVPFSDADAHAEQAADARDTVSPAKATAPAKEHEEPGYDSPFRIRQHKLSDGGETTIDVPLGTHILDVQVIDGVPHVRTVENIFEDSSEPFTVVIIPLGGAVDGRVTHIPARGTGVHFFVQDRSLSPGQG